MSLPEAIGGYFELELPRGEAYHKDLLALNSGRNALEYILRARGYQHISIPYYTCDVLLEPIRKLNIKYDFYSLNEYLEPETLPATNAASAFLYTNYFGLKAAYIQKLSSIIPNLIVDACQAFFYKPLKGIDTFYSPRKFFGVPDGGYVSCDIKLQNDFPVDISIDRFSHLLIRIDKCAEAGYEDFKYDDASLCNQPIKKISKLTRALLNSIDYQTSLNKRNENFLYLHSFLKDKNSLQWLEEDSIDGPMIYPFYSTNPELRKTLIDHQIYVAKYWPNVFDRVAKESNEYKYYENLMPLPIDQRYDEKELNFIIKRILEPS